MAQTVDWTMAGSKEDVGGGLQNQVKIVHQNVRGLPSKLELLQVFLLAESPDILCLTEHNLRKHEIDIFKLEGFCNISSFCRTDMERGGVCILAKTDVCVQELDVDAFCYEGECELAGALLSCGKEQVLLIAGYRPPTNNHHTFFENFSECLSKLGRGRDKIIVMGDFNIDLAKDSFIAS
jgi:exonuclease III